MSWRESNVRPGQIYVGNLPSHVKERDLEYIFEKFGSIKHINLKDRNEPPFAFIEFDDPRDAKDAIEDRDGYNFEGCTLRVQKPKGAAGNRGGRYGGGGGREGSGGFPGGGRSYGGYNDSRGYGSSRSRAPPQGLRRSNYRVRVSGLPPTGSWQDLKDHLRQAGDICFADVYKDGTGIVAFVHYDNMKYAVKHLDDTKFKSHEGETSYIRVKEDNDDERDKSRTRSRSRSRSARRHSRHSSSSSPAK